MFTSREMLEAVAQVQVIDDKESLKAWLKKEKEVAPQKNRIYRGHGEAAWITRSTLARAAMCTTAEAFHQKEKEALAQVEKRIKQRWVNKFRFLTKINIAWLQRLLTRFRRYRTVLLSCHCKNTQQLLMAMQHYGENTSIIDFSFDVDVALRFAVHHKDQKDCSTELKDYFSVVRVSLCSEFCDWESALGASYQNKPEDEFLEEFEAMFTDSVVEDLSSITQPVWCSADSFRPLCNERIARQKGCFIYLGKNSYSNMECVFAGWRDDLIKQGIISKDGDALRVHHTLIHKNLRPLVDKQLTARGVTWASLGLN